MIKELLANKRRLYAILVDENIEEEESERKLHSAIDLLFRHGYKADGFTAQGTLFGFLYVNKSEWQEANRILQTVNSQLSEKPESLASQRFIRGRWFF